jgi:hypothetical protein
LSYAAQAAVGPPVVDDDRIRRLVGHHVDSPILEVDGECRVRKI